MTLVFEFQFIQDVVSSCFYRLICCGPVIMMMIGFEIDYKVQYSSIFFMNTFEC